uniref:uncharacterized protein LOC105349988 n=1 Tax=Fragaria vesca subsp. vesca TaxID=101020 RepID=UPI0005CA0F52|nr:PREDICTED: uncharacterized protein LOC105349988 [Fragaria vesca subsp. vesca]
MGSSLDFLPLPTPSSPIQSLSSRMRTQSPKSSQSLLPPPSPKTLAFLQSSKPPIDSSPLSKYCSPTPPDSVMLIVRDSTPLPQWVEYGSRLVDGKLLSGILLHPEMGVANATADSVASVGGAENGVDFEATLALPREVNDVLQTWTTWTSEFTPRLNQD